ncbi:MAG: multidrug efflux SMR transporter [Rhodospirillales bacterium]
MTTNWILLLAAGLVEIVFATCLKLSDGFRKKVWTGLFIAAAAVSFFLLNRAIETIPLGTAYAVWTGIGAGGTALVGMLAFNEPRSLLRIVLLVVLIGAVGGLKAVSPE